jgi:hypothetical protein
MFVDVHKLVGRIYTTLETREAFLDRDDKIKASAADDDRSGNVAEMRRQMRNALVSDRCVIVLHVELQQRLRMSHLHHGRKVFAEDQRSPPLLHADMEQFIHHRTCNGPASGRLTFKLSIVQHDEPPICAHAQIEFHRRAVLEPRPHNLARKQRVAHLAAQPVPFQSRRMTVVTYLQTWCVHPVHFLSRLWSRHLSLLLW